MFMASAAAVKEYSSAKLFAATQIGRLRTSLLWCPIGRKVANKGRRSFSLSAAAAAAAAALPGGGGSGQQREALFFTASAKRPGTTGGTYSVYCRASGRGGFCVVGGAVSYSFDDEEGLALVVLDLSWCLAHEQPCVNCCCSWSLRLLLPFSSRDADPAPSVVLSALFRFARPARAVLPATRPQPRRPSFCFSLPRFFSGPPPASVSANALVAWSLAELGGMWRPCARFFTAA